MNNFSLPSPSAPSSPLLQLKMRLMSHVTSHTVKTAAFPVFTAESGDFSV